ncbi:threonine ammonia-lyase IlvA [Flavobacterium sp. FlaQc-48]|uniref:threonine ammonia-lyase IlvA n=1 Tax=Flavobacterium sp. FlaQc-48 TaxID=3374181 RepID=UPI0037568FF4
MDLLEEIQQAHRELYSIILPTPLTKSLNLSNKYGSSILLKREDQQIARSFKIRGAYNKMISLTNSEKERGIICASAGNHAQGVAYCCELLKIMGKIYMPKNTPAQKIKKVELLGGSFIKTVLVGDFFDQTYSIAMGDASINTRAFIHPFDDVKVIAGQGTVGIEILEEHQKPIDYIFIPLEGGGLAAGISTVFKQLSPLTKIIGVAIQDDSSCGISTLDKNSLDPIDQFIVDEPITKRNSLTAKICQKNLTAVLKIPEGKVCSAVLQLFKEEGINIEPTGVLSIAALDYYTQEIKGKKVVCIISNGLKNSQREPEILERSLLYEGLVHYLKVEFPQGPASFKEFVNEVLGPEDQITYFQSVKKDNCKTKPFLMRLELKTPNTILAIKAKMLAREFLYQDLSQRHDLFTSNFCPGDTAYLWEQ